MISSGQMVRAHALAFKAMCCDQCMLSSDENLAILREGCFKYFELGGECINGPVSLLSGYVSTVTSLLSLVFIDIPS